MRQILKKITEWYVRILNHYATNASHGAQAVCCILNWNIFVLKQKSTFNNNYYYFYYYYYYRFTALDFVWDYPDELVPER